MKRKRIVKAAIVRTVSFPVYADALELVNSLKAEQILCLPEFTKEAGEWMVTYADYYNNVPLWHDARIR